MTRLEPSSKRRGFADGLAPSPPFAPPALALPDKRIPIKLLEQASEALQLLPLVFLPKDTALTLYATRLAMISLLTTEQTSRTKERTALTAALASTRQLRQSPEIPLSKSIPMSSDPPNEALRRLDIGTASMPTTRASTQTARGGGRQPSRRERPPSPSDDSSSDDSDSPPPPSSVDDRQRRVLEIFAMFEPSGALHEEFDSYRSSSSGSLSTNPDELRTQLYCKLADLVVDAAIEDEDFFDKLNSTVPEAYCAIEEVKRQITRAFEKFDRFLEGSPAAKAYNIEALNEELSDHIAGIAHITNTHQRDKTAAVFAVGVLLLLVKRTVECAGELEGRITSHGRTIEAAVREIEAFPEDVLQHHEDGIKQTMNLLEEIETGASQLQATLARRLSKKAAFFTGAKKRRERRSGDEGSSKRRAK